MTWPAHGTTVRLASKHTSRVRDAIVHSVDVAALAQAWLETHPVDGSKPTPKQARDWAQVHGHVNTKPLENAIRLIYADGYVLGGKAGLYMLGHAIGLKKADAPAWIGDSRAAMVIDWNSWKPGNEAARALINQPGSLERLMNSRAVLSRDIATTTLDRIGTVLAQSLAAGTRPTASDLAGQLDSTIDDPQRALVIAQTEMARSVSVAARDLYETSGVEQVEWLVAEGCADCQDNADASPINIDDTFPSGDSEPPAHPNCLCSLAPYVVDTGNTGVYDSVDGGDNIDNVDVSGGGDIPDFTTPGDLSPDLASMSQQMQDLIPAGRLSQIVNDDHLDAFRDFRTSMTGGTSQQAEAAKAIFTYSRDNDLRALDTSAVQQLLDHAPTIPEDGLFRGMNVGMDTFRELSSSIKPGDIFDLGGPRSFSADRYVADNFARGYGPLKQDGQVTIAMLSGNGLPIATLSEYTSEAEWLVQQQLEVLQVIPQGENALKIVVRAAK